MEGSGNKKQSSMVSSIVSLSLHTDDHHYQHNGRLGICRGDLVSETGKRVQMCKMLFLTVMPIILLWGFNLYILTDTVTSKSDAEKNIADISSSLQLGQLVHRLQKERDMSILYLSALGPETKTFLLNEYINTDDAIAEIAIWPENFSIYNLDFLNSKESMLAHLSLHRQSLSKQKYDLFMELNFYNKIIDAILRWLIDTVTKEKFANVWRSLIAYIKICIGKQDVGIERALGTLYFVNGGFENQDAFELYNRKVNKFKAFYLTAQMYADSVSSMYKEGFFSAGYNVTAYVNHLRYIIKYSDENKRQPNIALARIWFDNMTIYMDALLTIQTELGEVLRGKMSIEYDSLTRVLGVTITVLVLAIVVSPVVTLFTESLTSNIQRYALTLVDKTKELSTEKKKTDSLLYQMMPRTVADKLKRRQNVDAEYFKSVTIMFFDIHQFSKIATECTPIEIVDLLNKLYSSIDEKLDNYDVYKVETINDCYMVASGVPNRNKDKHVREIASLSLDLLQTMNQKQFLANNRQAMKLRIGINTGPCMAGVVGIALPRYCLFGDSVNTASRMKSCGTPGRIHLARSSFEKLRILNMFTMKKRGKIDVKGKGQMITYWLIGKQTDSRAYLIDDTIGESPTDETPPAPTFGDLNLPGELTHISNFTVKTAYTMPTGSGLNKGHGHNPLSADVSSSQTSARSDEKSTDKCDYVAFTDDIKDGKKKFKNRKSSVSLARLDLTTLGPSPDPKRKHRSGKKESDKIKDKMDLENLDTNRSICMEGDEDELSENKQKYELSLGAENISAASDKETALDTFRKASL